MHLANRTNLPIFIVDVFPPRVFAVQQVPAHFVSILGSTVNLEYQINAPILMRWVSQWQLHTRPRSTQQVQAFHQYASPLCLSCV